MVCMLWEYSKEALCVWHAAGVFTIHAKVTLRFLGKGIGFRVYQAQALGASLGFRV